MTQVHDSEKTDPQGKSAKFAKKPYEPWEPMKQVSPCLRASVVGVGAA